MQALYRARTILRASSTRIRSLSQPMPDTPEKTTPAALAQPGEAALPCVMVFNANDPSGAGGLSCDAVAMASVGAHCLPICTGAYVRDTTSITDFYPLDEEAVNDQARAVAEDVPVQVINKPGGGGVVGFAEMPGPGVQ
eukprot:gene40090-52961_t